MESFQRIILGRLKWLAVLMAALILPTGAILQIWAQQNQARENAQAAFHQIRQVLEENTRELDRITEDYLQTSLHNAESIAYMIQHHPEILGDIEEFRRISRMIEVDEIHIFDKTGRIFTGTHPEYYDYTFDTGEQIGFFKPLLRDKSLRLCQEVTPNTAEGILVQYSALWSEDREFIVQVGMYPETIMEYTKKNELSYIFSLLQGSPGVDLYAIDSQSGVIMGSTSGGDTDKTMEDIGMTPKNLSQYYQGYRALVKGVDSYCIVTNMDGTLIAYVIATDTLYSNVPLYTMSLTLCVLLAIFLTLGLVWLLIRNYIVEGINTVNESLSAVSGGNLDERVEVRSSLEFSQLSDHINAMIHSILASTDKMSFVLNHANMPIGVYEYSTKMKTVRFTDHIPDIFKWDLRTRSQLSGDYHLLQDYLETLRKAPIPGEKNLYRLEGDGEIYIRLEEIVNGTDTLGIVIDMTAEILTRRRIEQERDVDLLTGLYNRRAMERQFQTIFQQDMGCGALIMIDSDSLKYINDVYGHTLGDRYLKKIAHAISELGSAQKLAVRQGGDEFVLLLYGYETEAALLKDLEELRYIQENLALSLENGSSVPVRFSFGYVLTEGRKDYATMLSEADGHMYAVKRKRKRAAAEESGQ